MKTNSRAKDIRSAIFWGVISISMYLLVFLNQETVLKYTTLGGYYAIVVITTALVFSFVHGAFTNYLIEVMGFKAAKQSKGGH